MTRCPQCDGAGMTCRELPHAQYGTIRVARRCSVCNGKGKITAAPTSDGKAAAAGKD